MRNRSKEEVFSSSDVVITAGNFGKGRLTKILDAIGTIIQTVSYGYDSLGRIASMALNGVNLVSSIAYQPFGPAKS